MPRTHSNRTAFMEHNPPIQLGTSVWIHQLRLILFFFFLFCAKGVPDPNLPLTSFGLSVSPCGAHGTHT